MTFGTVAQEVIIDSFVPNSVLLHGGHGIQEADDDEDGGGDGRMTGIEGNSTDEGRRTSLMVLTGANASGKSIYGKMVALLTYMYVSAIIVPEPDLTLFLASRAHIGWYGVHSSHRVTCTD